ncbi:putative FBD-associated F-box protein At5g38570 [Triticum urartu]|uniref:F-box domain-containing protein n=1 Tax=Triticum urartu TaxID=4572 RepID=A0A8R7V8M2_TRIUA|nr:putative FBD-associated F-box protein At5g38570 [Triticum urartu]
MERTRGHRRRKLSVAAGVGVGGGEDRLSALPDDVLVHILLKLRDAPVAARTSVLARRWRRVWALLPELHFPVGTDPDRIRAALTAHDAPALRHLFVAGIEVTPEIAAAWLPIAVRRLSGVLHFKNTGAMNEATAGERGTLKLPCFEKATKVVLDLHSIGLTLPPSGVFTRLTDLELVRIHLHGPCSLSDVVSSSRCPSLRRLSVCSVRGLDNFTIQSESLLQLELRNLHTLQQLSIVALSLQKLKVFLCFTDPLNQSQPVANISAPQLVTLDWRGAYDPRSVLFGEMPNLQQLTTNPLCAYGGDTVSARNHHSLMLSQHFHHISKLILILFYLPVHGNERFLMEEMTKLPNITVLGLFVLACGHSFGASSFHVLKMSSGIRQLTLQLVTRRDSKVCQPGCICAEPSNWETEDLVLPCLKEVAINGLRGTEHELALVKRLFKWATMLERVTVSFHDSISESNDEEFRQLLLSFSRPAICMKFSHGGGSLSFD